MPIAVYLLLLAWFVFAGWLNWSSRKALRELPDAYLENDLLWKILRRKLPRAQQRIHERGLLLLFGSLLLLVVLMILVMIVHADAATIKDLRDPFFREVYAERSMYLSR